MNHIPTHYERSLGHLGDNYRRAEERVGRLVEWFKSKQIPGLDPIAAAGAMAVEELIHQPPESRPGHLLAVLWAANWIAVKESAHPFSYRGRELDNLWAELGRAYRRDPLELMIENFGVVCDAWHRIEGRKVYAPTEALSRRLLATELRGLRSEDLRLPFRCIYVAVPVDLGLRVYHASTGWHPFEGAYLAEVEGSEVRQWKVLLAGSPKSAHPLDDAQHHFTLLLEAGRSLEEVLDYHEEHFDTYPCGGEDGWRPAFRFLMNVVIYATWPDAERDEVMLNSEARSLWDRIQKLPKVSVKRDRLKEELKRLDPRKRIVLGRSVPRYESSDAGTGAALVKRVQVQGHWRQQPHGPGMQLRKTIWIQPYWKGPEDGVFETPAEHTLV